MLVAWGLQETHKPQTETPSPAKEYFNLLMDTADNNKSKLVSINVGVAFLQAKSLEREIFLHPPEYQRKMLNYGNLKSHNLVLIMLHRSFG